MKIKDFIIGYFMAFGLIFLFGIWTMNAEKIERCYKYIDTQGVEHHTKGEDVYCDNYRSQMSCEIGNKVVSVIEYEEIDCEEE